MVYDADLEAALQQRSHVVDPELDAALRRRTLSPSVTPPVTPRSPRPAPPGGHREAWLAAHPRPPRQSSNTRGLLRTTR